MGRPRLKPNPTSSLAEQELDKCAEQFEEFDTQIKEMTMERMNKAPLREMEPQTQLSSRDLNKSKDIYLKPNRTISCREKFNERFRDEYNYAKEYVHFIAENKEIKGESVTLWIKKFPGMPAEEWIVPVNKPIWGPRYLAEQIRECKYHTFIMDAEKPRCQNQFGMETGVPVVEETVPRLTAEPVTTKRSIFMGATEFK